MPRYEFRIKSSLLRATSVSILLHIAYCSSDSDMFLWIISFLDAQWFIQSDPAPIIYMHHTQTGPPSSQDAAAV